MLIIKSQNTKISINISKLQDYLTVLPAPINLTMSLPPQHHLLLFPKSLKIILTQLPFFSRGKQPMPITKREGTKTYNRRDSLVVTHPTTNRPTCCLSMAELTGSPVLNSLWSYVKSMRFFQFISNRDNYIPKLQRYVLRE